MEFQKSRLDRRREEIPTWENRPEPLRDSAENEAQVEMAESSATRTSQRKKRRSEENRLERRLQVLSVTKDFPLALYRRPAPGRTLGITGQPDTLRTLLSYAARQVIKYAISVGTYIEATKTHSTLCKVFLRTTRELNQKVYADRIKADIVFQKDVARMVCYFRFGKLSLTFLVL